MNNPIPAMKAKLQSPEFQAEAKATAKAVVGAIVLGAVVTIGTQLAVKGLHVAAEKSTGLVKDLFSGEEVIAIDQDLVSEIANS